MMDSVYLLVEAGLFFAGAATFFVYALLRTGSTPVFIKVAALGACLLGIAFLAAHFFTGTADRVEVLGAIAKEVPFVVVLCTVCLVQAQYLLGGFGRPKLRSVLFYSPVVLGVSLVASLLFGFIWPTAALNELAAAPSQYLVFKLIFLLPEALYSATVTLLFLEAAAPRLGSAVRKLDFVSGSALPAALIRQPIAARLKVKHYAFCLGSAAWVLLALNATAKAVVRIFVPAPGREILVVGLLRVEAGLIAASLLAYAAGVIVLCAERPTERIAEQIMKWSAIREEIDLRIWGFSGEPAGRLLTHRYYLRKASQLLELEAEETKWATYALHVSALQREGEVSYPQLKLLSSLHDSLSKDSEVSAAVNKQVTLSELLGEDYDLCSDPLKYAVDAALEVSGSRDRATFFEREPWFQLFLVVAAHGGYLADHTLAARVRSGASTSGYILQAYRNAVGSAEFRVA